jgi:hypothetical protein
MAKMKRKTLKPSPECLPCGQEITEAANILKRIKSSPTGDGKPVCDVVDAAKAWALDCTLKESVAFFGELTKAEIEAALQDTELCRKLHGRFCRWMLAAVQWRIYELKKNCPEIEQTDESASKAVFAGLLASDRFTAGDNRVREFMDSAHTVTAELWELYQKLAKRTRPAPWVHSQLDTWLFLVWPLVEAEKWNYATVLSLAGKRFPNSNGNHPLSEARDFAKYCKKLGLRVRAQAGKPRTVPITPAVEVFALSLPTFDA